MLLGTSLVMSYQRFKKGIGLLGINRNKQPKKKLFTITYNFLYLKMSSPFTITGPNKGEKTVTKLANGKWQVVVAKTNDPKKKVGEILGEYASIKDVKNEFPKHTGWPPKE